MTEANLEKVAKLVSAAVCWLPVDEPDHDVVDEPDHELYDEQSYTLKYNDSFSECFIRYADP